MLNVGVSRSRETLRRLAGNGGGSGQCTYVQPEQLVGQVITPSIYTIYENMLHTWRITKVNRSSVNWQFEIDWKMYQPINTDPIGNILFGIVWFPGLYIYDGKPPSSEMGNALFTLDHITIGETTAKRNITNTPSLAWGDSIQQTRIGAFNNLNMYRNAVPNTDWPQQGGRMFGTPTGITPGAGVGWTLHTKLVTEVFPAPN